MYEFLLSNGSRNKSNFFKKHDFGTRIGVLEYIWKCEWTLREKIDKKLWPLFLLKLKISKFSNLTFYVLECQTNIIHLLLTLKFKLGRSRLTRIYCFWQEDTETPRPSITSIFFLILHQCNGEVPYDLGNFRTLRLPEPYRSSKNPQPWRN